MFTQSVLLYHRKKLTVMLSFILNLLILDGIFALFGAAYRGPGIIDTQFYEVTMFFNLLHHIRRMIDILPPEFFNNKVWSQQHLIVDAVLCVSETRLGYDPVSDDAFLHNMDPYAMLCCNPSHYNWQVDKLISTYFFPFLEEDSSQISC